MTDTQRKVLNYTKQKLQKDLDKLLDASLGKFDDNKITEVRKDLKMVINLLSSDISGNKKAIKLIDDIYDTDEFKEYLINN